MTHRLSLITILLFGCFLEVVSQTETNRVIKVNFLYGSKPKRKFKKTEQKVFGGLHGGHVSVGIDDTEVGFEPTNKVHVFPRKKGFMSAFVCNQLNGAPPYNSSNKTATFIVPVTDEQYLNLRGLASQYCSQTPYDYAFFGMRCAAATRDLLGQAGLLKERRRVSYVTRNFYPKRLRKRMFRMAKSKGWTVLKTEGRDTRRWERD